MMNTPTNRRNLLKTAGATALTVATAQAAAQSGEVRGTVTFSDGSQIPAGYLKVRLEDPTVRNKAQRRLAEVRIKTKGADKAVPFVLAASADSSTASAKLEIVARLEREDGWLIARGSAQFEAGRAVNVTLNTVQY